MSGWHELIAERAALEQSSTSGNVPRLYLEDYAQDHCVQCNCGTIFLSTPLAACFVRHNVSHFTAESEFFNQYLMPHCDQSDMAMSAVVRFPALASSPFWNCPSIPFNTVIPRFACLLKRPVSRRAYFINQWKIGFLVLAVCPCDGLRTGRFLADADVLSTLLPIVRYCGRTIYGRTCRQHYVQVARD
ncbi:hypothetical protein MRB53_042117 [Persea americana]|nr:hypothetical protein MRB53_042117 [Persea americana]